jgi:hypothetical protein
VGAESGWCGRAKWTVGGWSRRSQRAWWTVGGWSRRSGRSRPTPGGLGEPTDRLLRTDNRGGADPAGRDARASTGGGDGSAPRRLGHAAGGTTNPPVRNRVDHASLGAGHPQGGTADADADPADGPRNRPPSDVSPLPPPAGLATASSWGRRTRPHGSGEGGSGGGRDPGCPARPAGRGSGARRRPAGRSGARRPDRPRRRGPLAALSGLGAVPPSPERLRQEAEALLSRPPFRPRSLPHPLAGPLRALGRALDTAGTFLAHQVAPIVQFSEHHLGTQGLLDLALAGLALVLVIVGVAAFRLLGRTTRAGVEPFSRRRPARVVDAAALEAEADRLERSGRLDLAFRLRFRAGIVRLEQDGALAVSDAETPRELAQRLGSPSLGVLARDLEEIVFAGRPAGAGDLATARERWPRVLDEVRR